MDDTTVSLSPFIFNAVQNNYIQNFSLAFSQISHFAIQFFYILATLEICLFGIIWALKQQEMFGLFIFKIIKLAFIFFLISHYTDLLDALVNGLAQIGLGGGNEKVAKLVFTPDLIWHYGFDSSISLLSLAVQYGTANLGMSLIYLILGFGTLLMLALIACQIVLLVVGFYLLSLMALLFLPFGSFVLTEKLFSTSLHGVFKAAVRIFGLIVILGVGIGIWAAQAPGAFAQSTTLDKPLGLFMATLVITLLCWKVPGLLAAAVGEFGGELFGKTSGESTTQSASVAVSAPPAAVTQVAAASNLSASTSTTQSGMPGSTSSTSSGSNVNVNAGGSGAGISKLSQNMSELTRAAKVQKEGISRDTLHKLKASFKEILKEKN